MFETKKIYHCHYIIKGEQMQSATFQTALKIVEESTDNNQADYDALDEKTVTFDHDYELAINSPKIDFSDVFLPENLLDDENFATATAQSSLKIKDKNLSKADREAIANNREKNYCCPAEDKPGIYLLCSLYSIDWYEKCEIMNEFLTSAFLGKPNIY